MTTEQFFNFIVPVWGESYTRLFTDTCLPMLLTPGNLYSRTSYTSNDHFTIVTTWHSYQLIKASPAYEELAKLIDVNFILIDGLVDLTEPYFAMTYCYAKAMKQAYVIPTKTFFIFLTPDSFWSEGTFERLYECAKDYKVVMAMGLRVNAESMAKTLAKLHESENNLTLPNDKLIPLVFANLHQMSKAHNLLSGTKFLNEWPSHLYWFNEQDQLVAHCFHLHPLMVQSPAKKIVIGTTIDAEFLDNLNYPIDSYHIFQDKYFGIELSPEARNWDQPLGAPCIKNIIRFSLLNANNTHWYFFKHRIIISNNLTITPALEKVIDELVMQIPCMRNTILHALLHFKPFIGLRKIIALIILLPMRLQRASRNRSLFGVFKFILSKIKRRLLSA